VRFLRPYDEVIGLWRRSIAYAYDPERLLERFTHQVDATYANRMVAPAGGKLTWSNVSFAAGFAARMIYHVGIKSAYRRPFWRAIRHALRRGQIDSALGIGFVAHHLIEFTREALRGDQNASFYSALRKQHDIAPPVLDAPFRKSA